MHYREFAPPKQLSTVVECFWSSTKSSSTCVMHRVLPHNCTDIIFDSVREGYRNGVVCGTMTTALHLQDMKACRSVGARLRPGVASVLLGHPANHFTDQIIGLDSVIEKSFEMDDVAEPTLLKLQMLVESLVANVSGLERIEPANSQARYP